MSKIIIIGAGPTGLGAARRLEELGHKNWQLLESSSHAGGLASSFVDEKVLLGISVVTSSSRTMNTLTVR